MDNFLTLTAPCTGTCAADELRRKNKMAKLMGEWAGVSSLRLWWCELMMARHPLDDATMKRVQASLQSEEDMARFVGQTRSDQQTAGTHQRACGVTAQVDIVGTSVPLMQEKLDKPRSEIVLSTQTQFLAVTTGIAAAATQLTNIMNVGFDAGCEASRNSDLLNLDHHTTAMGVHLANQASLQKLDAYIHGSVD
jgi:hypothetical protein